jgi:hypothetical protein
VLLWRRIVCCASGLCPSACCSQPFLTPPVLLVDLALPADAVGTDIWPSASSSSNGFGSSSSSSSSSKPLATWTITSDDEGMPLDSADLPPMTPAAVAASQTGARRFGSSWRMAQDCASCVLAALCGCILAEVSLHAFRVWFGPQPASACPSSLLQLRR